MLRSLTSQRGLRLGLTLIALVMASGVASKAAMAKPKSCADQVIADWYDDGRVGKIYPLECYRQAIAKLPPDVLDYSNAKEEIGRALAYAKLGKPDPGGSRSQTTSTATTGTETSTGSSTTTKTTTTKTTKSDPTPTDTIPTVETTTIDTTTTADTSGPSSVPVPLLVLGGLAVLLLAAGSAGYLRRRMNGGDDGDGTPPVAPPPVA